MLQPETARGVGAASICSSSSLFAMLTYPVHTFIWVSANAFHRGSGLTCFGSGRAAFAKTAQAGRRQWDGKGSHVQHVAGRRVGFAGARGSAAVANSGTCLSYRHDDDVCQSAVARCCCCWRSNWWCRSCCDRHEPYASIVLGRLRCSRPADDNPVNPGHDCRTLYATLERSSVRSAQVRAYDNRA